MGDLFPDHAIPQDVQQDLRQGAHAATIALGLQFKEEQMAKVQQTYETVKVEP